MELKLHEVYILEYATIRDKPFERQVQLIIDMAKTFEVEPLCIRHIEVGIQKGAKYFAVDHNNVCSEQTWLRSLSFYQEHNYKIKDYRLFQTLGEL